MSDSNIKQTLDRLVMGIVAQTRTKARESELYDFLLQNPDVLSNPDNFYFSFVYKQRNVVEEALLALKNMPPNKATEYSDIFQDAHFYKSQLKGLCRKYEGMACSADKAGAVLHRYFKFLESGEMGAWEVNDPKCFWLPRFGTQQQWFNLIHGLWIMRCGDPGVYFKTYIELCDAGRSQQELNSEQKA